MRPFFVLGAVALALYGAATLAGVDSPLLTRDAFIALQAVPAALILACALRTHERRFARVALGLGLCSSVVGWILLSPDATAPEPGVADIAWLGLYVGALATFVALARPWLRRAPVKLGFDAATILLAATALVIAIVVPRTTEHFGDFNALVTFAYPIADCLLLTIAVIGALVAGRQADTAWNLLAAAVAAQVLGDIAWAARAAEGTWAPAMGTNAFYPLFAWLAALAVLQKPDPRPVMPNGIRTQTAALVAAAGAIGLLAIGEWIEVPATAVVLASVAILLMIRRSAVAVGANVRTAMAAARERELVDDVRHALEHERLELYFQPLVDARTGAVRGAEALLRWQREDGGFVAPDEFLPAVERSDLIGPLTDWVLDRALAAAVRWNGPAVSINLAIANLSEPDLPERVLAALERHGLPPSGLTLELTETAELDDSPIADAVMTALDASGVRLSVDDFGTGHSSIVRLARFPIRELKIDRTFVRDMHVAPRPIVATTIEMARALGLEVVAEGIEDERTLVALRELGCDLAQGYHVSRPLPAAEFERWLAAHSAPLLSGYDW